MKITRKNINLLNSKFSNLYDFHLSLSSGEQLPLGLRAKGKALKEINNGSPNAIKEDGLEGFLKVYLRMIFSKEYLNSANFLMNKMIFCNCSSCSLSPKECPFYLGNSTDSCLFKKIRATSKDEVKKRKELAEKIKVVFLEEIKKSYEKKTKANIVFCDRKAENYKGIFSNIGHSNTSTITLKVFDYVRPRYNYSLDSDCVDNYFISSQHKDFYNAGEKNLYISDENLPKNLGLDEMLTNLDEITISGIFSLTNLKNFVKYASEINPKLKIGFIPNFMWILDYPKDYNLQYISPFFEEEKFYPTDTFF